MATAWLDLNSPYTPELKASLDDQSLVSALQAADSGAYERLLQRFQNPIYNLAWRLVNNAADALDVTQDVFFKVFRNIQSFRGECSLRTWIYRIAVHEACNRRRWLFRHRRGQTGIEDALEGETGLRDLPIADTGVSPFDFTLNEEARLLLQEGMDSLNPAFRATLVLREIEELSYEEIAAITGVSVGTVKSRIVRGREALRRYLVQRMNPAPSMGTSGPRRAAIMPGHAR